MDRCSVRRDLFVLFLDIADRFEIGRYFDRISSLSRVGFL